VSILSRTEPGERDASTPAPVLTAESVSVSLSGRRVLEGVSFRLEAGELTGLIGSNGAGKTTLFRAVLGLQPLSEGRIVIEGRPSERGGARIGYVPQKIVLDPDLPLRARDVVALGIDGHRLGFSLGGRRRTTLVDATLEAVGAERLANARVGTLSGGEQQRVLIAHALVSQPCLLLLDEPLANLDIRAEREVAELLGRIAHDQGVAILISAHDMNPLLPVMDRIVYLAGGRAASGTTDEVVRPEVLSPLYGQHVDVLHVHDRILVVAGADASLPALAQAAGLEPGAVRAG
jgi:zinc/manganese transport system ATP-binding protein